MVSVPECTPQKPDGAPKPGPPLSLYFSLMKILFISFYHIMSFSKPIHRLVGLSEVREISEPKLKAISLVVTHKANVRDTAVHFNIAKSTLQDAKKAVKEERDLSTTGRPKVFNEEEEEDMVVQVLQMDMLSTPFTKKEFLALVCVPLAICPLKKLF